MIKEEVKKEVKKESTSKSKFVYVNYDISLHNHQSPVSCFCLNIKPERFRLLSSKIEKMVDRKNSLIKIKRLFSLTTFNKIKELGLARAFQKGVRVFLSKK